jgi:aspartate carbamoyltransferase catalytic subunit
MSHSLSWNRKDLIDVEYLSREEIETIFTASTAFKKAMEADDNKQPYLSGRTVVNLFLEPSTRTRLAFEVAASRLSADTITVTGAASSLTKGETLRDTAQNMAALQADMIIMRHSASGAPHYLSKVVDIPVIKKFKGHPHI